MSGAARRGQAAGHGGERPGPGWLWLLLAPLACCGLPLLAAGLAAAGALAWGGLGLGLALAVAGAAQYVRHHRRACPAPAAARRPGPGRPLRQAPPRLAEEKDLTGYRVSTGQPPGAAGGQDQEDRHADRDRAR